MREQRNDPKRLQDILQAIDTIFQYVDGRDMEAFVADKKTYHAVIYNIMIIGEAANMLTFEFRESHTELRWRQITNMRNFLIHGYHTVEETNGFKYFIKIFLFVEKCSVHEVELYQI